MEKYCVYVHRNKINGKIYVGMTNNPKRRWGNVGAEYRPSLGSNVTHFWRAIEKYGWDNFEHEILVNNLDIDQARLREEYYIALWDSTNKYKGYNMSKGGNGGMVYEAHPKGMLGKTHTREWSKQHSKDIQRAAERGCYKDIWKNNPHPKGMKNKPQTTKQRMAMSNGAVRVVLPNGEFYESISVKGASRDLNIPETILYKLYKNGGIYKNPRNFPQYKCYNGLKVEHLQENTEITK